MVATYFCRLGVRRAQQKIWILPALVSGKKLPLQPSSWRQTIQIIPIVPWHVSSFCPRAEAQNEWIHQQVSLCVRPLRRMLGLQLPSIHLFPTSPGFKIQKLWRLLSLEVEPWPGKPGVGPLTPLGGSLQPRYLSLLMGMWDQLIPTHFHMAFVFVSWVAGLLFSQTSSDCQ